MLFYDKRDSRGRYETLQGKDLIDFITKNDLLEANVLIWNNDIEFGTEPHMIEVDKAGNIVLIQLIRCLMSLARFAVLTEKNVR